MRILLVILYLLLWGWRLTGEVATTYEYDRTIGSYWTLGVKASTLALKADYLNRFVAAVDSARLTGHNALLLPTPNNDVATNLATLKNLQARMQEIRRMADTSLSYQQAISQITAQEQDEAGAMLGVLEGRWFLTHHPFYWEWISLLVYTALIGLGILGYALVIDE